MFSHEFQCYTEDAYQRVSALLPNLKPQMDASISRLSGDEALLLKFLYATLPVSDVALLKTEMLLGYIRHALFLRETSPFCKDLTEDLFLHFVFYPRINTEDLVDCRSFFYELLTDRIRGLSQEEAILEINRFCCENMTYQTTNNRTQNPLTSYNAGLGRCGEESTFAVTCFRSVGIPARQIYVPYWVHCDDNHAWVEVFTGSQWCFLGACEPEPVLNRGWFTDASSRAPLACYRSFFDYRQESMKQETLYETRGISHFYNVTDHYAEVSLLTIRIETTNGTPCAHYPLRLSVVNYASYADIIRGVTDENGLYSIRLGRVSLHVEAFGELGFAMRDIQIGEEDLYCTLRLTSGIQPDTVTEADFIPPAVSPKNRTVLSEEQQEANKNLLQICADKRHQRISGYFLPAYLSYPEELQSILKVSGANASEISQFFSSLPNELQPLGLRLLNVLESKDYRDIRSDVLTAHLYRSLPYQKEEHFDSEILNPRIADELIEDYRSVISAAFSEEEAAAFRKDPETLYRYIEDHFKESGARYYPSLSMLPSETLKAGVSDTMGRKLLFTAALRTFGVPARLNPADGSCEYFRNGCYHTLKQEDSEPTDIKKSRVIFSTDHAGDQNTNYDIDPDSDDTKTIVTASYFGNYSIDRFVSPSEGYVTLDFSSDPSISLDPGHYRLLTTNRLPNGSQLTRTIYFTTDGKSVIHLPFTVRSAEASEMLSNASLDAFTFTDTAGHTITSDELLRRKTLLLYLDVSKEPTEHILNELYDLRETYHRFLSEDTDLYFIIRSEKELSDPTLQKVLNVLPLSKVIYDDFKGTATMLSRKLFQEPGVWPLLIITDESRRGYYGTCGYSVGTAALCAKLLSVIKHKKES